MRPHERVSVKKKKKRNEEMKKEEARGTTERKENKITSKEKETLNGSEVVATHFVGQDLRIVTQQIFSLFSCEEVQISD